MPTFTILLDPTVAVFYARIAEITQRPVEQVLSDALFKLAGELALESLAQTPEQTEHGLNIN